MEVGAGDHRLQLQNGAVRGRETKRVLKKTRYVKSAGKQRKTVTRIDLYVILTLIT
jgi:hypothetical protein